MARDEPFLPDLQKDLYGAECAIRALKVLQKRPLFHFLKPDLQAEIDELQIDVDKMNARLTFALDAALDDIDGWDYLIEELFPLED